MAAREFAGGGGVDLTRKMGSHNNGRPLDSAFASAPSNYFLGAGAMVSFGGVDGGNGSRNSIYHPFFNPQETGDEYLDDYVTQPEKKRRLSVDQVQFLEKSFEVENKLEPDRKLQLANELSLQPRQIAVWFQNRRARCKTKSLETEYETLHSSYKSLRTDYDSLLKENEKLKAEVLHLKHEEKDEPSESALMLKEDDAGMISTVDERRAPVSTCKNEEQSESSNDFDPLLESVLWIHGEDIFPKIEDAHCYPNATVCGYGFGVEVEDHALSNFWSY